MDGYVDHLTPVVRIAMNIGMRRGELLSMTWADINWEAKMLTIQAENAKSGRQRHIPLNVEAMEVLQRWGGQAGERRTGKVFEVSDIKKGWGKLIADARIEQFRFHDLRHHFASRLARAGVDLNTVRELLGHADITMTLRYAHLAPDSVMRSASSWRGLAGTRRCHFPDDRDFLHITRPSMQRSRRSTLHMTGLRTSAGNEPMTDGCTLGE